MNEVSPEAETDTAADESGAPAPVTTPSSKNNERLLMVALCLLVLGSVGGTLIELVFS